MLGMICAHGGNFCALTREQILRRQGAKTWCGCREISL